MTKICKPWPAGHKIRSPYGMRKHPITGRMKKHRGVDVAYNGLIHAPADGVVVHKADDWHAKPHWQKLRDTGGNTLIIQHHNPKVWTVYYHLSEPSPLAVGAKVKQGDPIGHTGTTGASTGVHLHFETRRSRTWGTDFDPETILDSCHANSQSRPTVDTTLAKPKKLKVDGILGPNTWRAIQRMLNDQGGYRLAVDGRPGRSTIQALQQWLNHGEYDG